MQLLARARVQYYEAVQAMIGHDLLHRPRRSSRASAAPGPAAQCGSCNVHREKTHHFDPGPSAAEAALQACATMPERSYEQDALKPGEAVRIYNLTGRPELNHRRGKVVSYAKAKGRYAVEVPGLPNVMLFKLANLQLVSVEDVAPLEPHSIVLPQQHLSPSRYTDNRGAGPPATAEDDAAGDSLDYDALLASIDFAMLRDHLLRAGSRPGCAPMPGRQLRQLPAHRSCLVGLVGILLRSRDGPATLVQQAADALSRICTFGAAGRSAVRRAGGAAARVHRTSRRTATQRMSRMRQACRPRHRPPNRKCRRFPRARSRP